MIFEGGIEPNEVIRLLSSSIDVLPPTEYEKVKSAILVEGTNALKSTGVST